MKTKIVLFAILTTTMVAFLSCSKDNEDTINTYYSTEQQKTLNVLHGIFKSVPDIIGTTTIFNFKETYIKKPETLIGRNISGGTKDITIHGICEYEYNFVNNDTDDKYERAFYISTNGIDMTLYYLNNDKTISLNSSSEKYKIMVINENQIKITDVDFPLNGQIFNRIN